MFRALLRAATRAWAEMSEAVRRGLATCSERFLASARAMQPQPQPNSRMLRTGCGDAVRVRRACSRVSLSALGTRQALLSEKVSDANSRAPVIRARGSRVALRSTRRVMRRARRGSNVEETSRGRGSLVDARHRALSSERGCSSVASFRRCSHWVLRRSISSVERGVSSAACCGLLRMGCKHRVRGCCFRACVVAGFRYVVSFWLLRGD